MKYSIIQAAVSAILLLCSTAAPSFAQKQKSIKQATASAALITGNYPNIWRQAGYRQDSIDAKVAKAYHDVFEGPNKVYFEVGNIGIAGSYKSTVKRYFEIGTT